MMRRAQTSRRLIVLLLLVFVIAGCGQAPEAEPVVIVGETAVTRTIQHTFGTSEIPKEPQLLNELGVTMLPTGSARDELDVRNGRAFISDERWDLISGEPLILLQAPSVEGEMEAVAEVNENPLWAQLPAVQAGNVVTLDRLGYPGFRGQRALLQDLVAALE